MKIVKIFAMSALVMGLASCSGEKKQDAAADTQTPAEDASGVVYEYEIIEIDGVPTAVDKDGNPVDVPEGTVVTLPDADSESTAEKVKDAVVDKTKEVAGDVADKTKEVAGAVADKTKEVAGDVADKAKEAKDATVDKAKELADKAKQEIQKI